MSLTSLKREHMVVSSPAATLPSVCVFKFVSFNKLFRQFSFPIKCYSHVFTLVGKTVEGDRHVFVLFFVRS